MTVFPEPQISELTGATFELTAPRIILGDRASALERHAASLIEKMVGSGDGVRIILGTPTSNPSIPAVLLEALADKPNSDQGYVISSSVNEIILAANEPIGVLYAAQTLLQMIEPERSCSGGGCKSVGGAVPEGRIVDWPERKYRGIFAESRWCSELMTLQDWKDAIDLLASLKFNVLNVGVANNWMIQYEHKRSEFFLLPIRKYPELRAPQSIEYYSAKAGDYVHAEYLPLMFTEDFFGDVVAYGASRGITVYPHFNTPGHNTLIPRKIPEISAKDENGCPTGFGFCLSNPKTYEVMFNIVDEIADRYLLPNGVTFFHLGLDEVWPILGMDESEPTRVVSPYCQCPDCRGREWYDWFVDYVVALCKHLADKGMTKIGLWHDSFVRGGRMNEELADRFRREGIVDKVVLHWWRYGGFFDTIHPELGFASWVVPMTGYYYFTPLQDHLTNIYLAARKAAEENAEGAESYTVYYNAYFRNYACLAEYSWNPNAGGLDGFRDKYTRFLFGDAPEGREAFKRFDFTTGPMGPTNWSIYYYSVAYGLNRRAQFIRENYPRPIVSGLADNPGAIQHNLGMICENARAAKRIFDQTHLWRRNPANLAKAYSAEMARTAASAHVFLRLAQATAAYRAMQEDGEPDAKALKSRCDEIRAAIDEMDAAILQIETDLPYMAPSIIRELTLQRRFAVAFLEELDERVAKLLSAPERAGEAPGSGCSEHPESVPALPDLECLRAHPIRWVGKAHKGD